MDVIKTERDIDPLAIETSDNTDLERKNPLFEEVNLLTLQSIPIKVESEGQSYNLTSEIKFEETPAQMGKWEPEERNLLDLHTTPIKTEYVHQSCDLTPEIKAEETRMPVNSPAPKSETELLSVVMATFHVFVLLLALHASMGQNPCLQKSADFANFDIGKFSGTWYTLYHSYNSTDYICYIDTYEALSRSEATLHTSRIDTKTGERNNATGVVQVSDNVLSATISKYRTPSYHVFSTDYVNYAFVGLCRKAYSLTWLALREKIPSSVAITAAEKGLKTYGLNLDDFIKDCKYNSV
ncbi:uncharacterized protein [Periplaneta americana]|uniref:uncharacterized protein isoform X3 n=1 Tax=Periplaneta americana TaxID=6978 RepID=UPI0037E8FE7F